MLYTTVPPFIISLVVYGIVGMNSTGAAVQSPEKVQIMLSTLDTIWNWNIIPLIPWSMAGVYMASTLGVSVVEYAPWAILCYTGFIFAIIYGFTGFSIEKTTNQDNKYSNQASVIAK